MAPKPPDYDEFCDPDKPNTVSYEVCKDAMERVRPFVIKTPCIPCMDQKRYNMNLFYKCEFLQKSGSFKERGAINLLELLPTDKRKIGLVVASLGNFGVSLCLYAKKKRVPVVVIMPVTVPLAKVQRCHSYGAQVFLHGKNLMEAQKHAKMIAKEKGMTFINSRDHPAILAGHGTLAVELMQEAPWVDAVVVPVGYGGLAAAIAAVVKQIKPECLVYGVQSEDMPTFFRSLEENERIVIAMQNSQADAIAVPDVGVNSFHTLKPLLDKMILVKEDWISRAMLRLNQEHFVVEPAGACSVAALIGNQVPELVTKNVICILSGGNIDGLQLARCLDRGMAQEGLLIKFRVGVKNDTEGLRNLCNLLVSTGYQILNNFIHRQWTEDDVYLAEICLVCHAKDLEDALQLKRLMDRAYPCRVTFDTEPFSDKRTCPCYVHKDIC